jgi:hypothetical protein
MHSQRPGLAGCGSTCPGSRACKARGYTRGVSTGGWIICKPELSRRLQNYQPLARHFHWASTISIVK